MARGQAAWARRRARRAERAVVAAWQALCGGAVQARRWLARALAFALARWRVVMLARAWDWCGSG